MSDWKKRITINPNHCGGRPCIRGMTGYRYTRPFSFRSQVLEELPDLKEEDIEAALKYASNKLDHPIIAA